MATQQDQLIQAIRRIAKSDPEIRSLLTVLQKRGALDGLVKLVGGADAAALEDCCTKDDDADPEDGEPEDISEDAPPEVPDIGDEDGDGEPDWSDCETGEPITFTPGGFPQPETCKDCDRPDPDWQAGYKWWSNPFGFLGYFASPGLAVSAINAYVLGGDICSQTSVNTGNVTNNEGEVFQKNYEMYRTRCDDGEIYFAGTYSIARYGCVSADYDSGDCTIEPQIIDDCRDWEPDGATSYTLANGCITASSCDPDASAQTQQCNECITICNKDGEERRVCAIGNGQWVLYDPNGKYKGGRYDATGRRLEILPAGETGGYLPSERNPTGGGGYDGGTIGGGDGWVWS